MSKLYTCNTCKKKKQKNEFYIRKNGNLVDHNCKSCLLEKKKENREENYEYVRSLERAKIARNPEKYREINRRYFKNNQDKCNKATRDHYHRNADKERARTAIKRAERLKRIPKWLSKEDQAKIRSVYKSCRSISKKTGVEHHVDHIVPLQGKNVSGLHVPWNLQVISKEENLSKGNQLIEDIV